MIGSIIFLVLIITVITIRLIGQRLRLPWQNQQDRCAQGIEEIEFDTVVVLSCGQFLFINSKFHYNSFLSIPESIPIPLALRKVNSNSQKVNSLSFHPRMRFLIHIEQLYNNLI